MYCKAKGTTKQENYILDPQHVIIKFSQLSLDSTRLMSMERTQS